MKPENIIEDLLSGKIDKKSALDSLSAVANLGFAKLDLTRHKRTGFFEVIYGAGKTFEQLKKIIQILKDKNKPVFVTRLPSDVAETLQKTFPDLIYQESVEILSSTFVKPGNHHPFFSAVISAGTSDQKVAEEAALTAEFMGVSVKRFYDVGVAGIHRLFDQLDVIRSAAVIIVVAGMDGALPSIVGGLVDKPVIAIPTSIGYGANFGGLAPLLTMLNACSSGITVVNIDNGFGGGMAAAQIIRNIKSLVTEPSSCK